MRYLIRSFAVFGLLCGLNTVGMTAEPQETIKPAPPTAVGKLHQALEQKKTLEVNDPDFIKAIKQLSEQTGIPFDIDLPTQQWLGLGVQGLPQVLLPGFNIRTTNEKVRTALDRALRPHGVTYAIVADRVLITAPERAVYFQMRQKVSFHFNKVELKSALDQLAVETGVNIVLDPVRKDDAKLNVTLQLHDVPLDAAVRVVAGSVGLHSVRISNVLFVTMVDKAQSLGQDLPDLHSPLPPFTQPFPMGGQFGLMGALGVAGIGGVGGQLGIGGGAPSNGVFGMPPMGGRGGFGGHGGGVLAERAASSAWGNPSRTVRLKPPGPTPVELVVHEDRLALRHTPAPMGVNPMDPALKPACPSSLQLALQTRAELIQRHAFDHVDDPTVTLDLMLTSLSQKFSRPGDLPPFYLGFKVNTRAFAAENVEDVLQVPVAERKLPRLINGSLANYLRQLLERIPVPSGAVFVIRNNTIEITTRKALIAEFYPNRTVKETTVLPPLIHAVLDKRPLEEALRQLSEAADGYNIVLDVSVKEPQKPVTANFHNVPVDTAVRLLAHMAGLTMVEQDNVLYVTSKENAATLPHKK